LEKVTDDQRRQRFERIKAAIANGGGDVVVLDPAGRPVERNPQTALDTPAPPPAKSTEQ
jgi:hypothetical protein